VNENKREYVTHAEHLERAREKLCPELTDYVFFSWELDKLIEELKTGTLRQIDSFLTKEEVRALHLSQDREILKRLSIYIIRDLIFAQPERDWVSFLTKHQDAIAEEFGRLNVTYGLGDFHKKIEARCGKLHEKEKFRNALMSLSSAGLYTKYESENGDDVPFVFVRIDSDYTVLIHELAHFVSDTLLSQFRYVGVKLKLFKILSGASLLASGASVATTALTEAYQLFFPAKTMAESLIIHTPVALATFFAISMLGLLGTVGLASATHAFRQYENSPEEAFARKTQKIYEKKPS
jgi:hypothetical protein